MPELFRAYGELLREKQDTEALVFAALLVIVLLFLAPLTIGALIEAAFRAWMRSRDRERPSTGRSDGPRQWTSG
jgi:uncharacterized protein YecT (DUF1311 family)